MMDFIESVYDEMHTVPELEEKKDEEDVPMTQEVISAMT